MRHYGDIRGISGYAVEPVNVVVGGSPCQDLSVAGKQRGLAGERSGLFMEQIRIVKELRTADVQRRGQAAETKPRFMLWENVLGAFSSNGGADFAAVLREIVRVVNPQASPIPMPKYGWPMAGCIFGAGCEWSIAWRVFDAQFWGVPQRRRRIALVADFAGGRAPEILFERESVRGDSSQISAKGQTAPADAGGGAQTVFCIQGNMVDRETGQNGSGWRQDQSYTLNTVDRFAVVYDARGGGSGYTAATVTGDHERRVTDYSNIVCMATGQAVSKPPCRYVIRRLTPLECERLQGFPDGWTDIGPWTDTKGKRHAESSDAARYKALGNSIAIPPWYFVMRRLSLCCAGDWTMASLFDGIGGFPLIWEGINGRGTCVWASEIDEFPIAVTKYHFPEQGLEV